MSDNARTVGDLIRLVRKTEAQEVADLIEEEATFAERIMALPPGAGQKRQPFRPDFRYNARGCAGRSRGK